MKLEVIGPLLFWTLMFVVASAIKFVTFNDSLFWLQIGPELSLWSTGILFTLAASEDTYDRARKVRTVTHNHNDRTITIGWDVEPPDDVAFTPRFIYLFLVGVAIWIVSLLLSGLANDAYGASGTLDKKTFWLAFSSLVFPSLMVGVALRSLYEVNR